MMKSFATEALVERKRKAIISHRANVGNNLLLRLFVLKVGKAFLGPLINETNISVLIRTGVYCYERR